MFVTCLFAGIILTNSIPLLFKNIRWPTGTPTLALISDLCLGLGLGATPTAIANMTAVAEKYGASPQAFLVIPLVGAFFIDIANAVVVKLILAMVS
jgi:ESS family glutamate:Na+ symporter